MNQYNPAIHHRRSIRLKGYDYSQAGLYFITLCCHDRQSFFGKVQHGAMVLSPWGEVVVQEWLRTAELRPNVALHEFVVMPNHFHAILEIKYQVVGKGGDGSSSKGGVGSKGGDGSKGELQFAPTLAPTTTFKSPSQTVGAIIRGFKGAVTTRIRKGEEDGKGELQFAPTTLAPTTTQKIWQRDYYEHIIRDEIAYERIANYILNNPLSWEKDSLK